MSEDPVQLSLDDDSSQSDIPEIFSVSESSGEVSFTRRNFIKAAGTVGATIAVFGIAENTVAQNSTPTSTATPCFVRTRGRPVDIHAEPRANSEILGRLAIGRAFLITERATDADGNVWFRLDIADSDTDENWVQADIVRIVGDCAELGTATPTAEAEPCTIMTDRDDIQVHVGPGRSRGVRAFLPPNEEFVVLGVATDSDGGLWYKVDITTSRLAGQETWVYSEDVESFGGCGQLRDAEVPPVQTASSNRPQATSTNAATEVPAGNPGDVGQGQTGINYTAPDGTHYTLPCGSPLPPGAVCTCNCVTVPAPQPPSSGGGSGGGGSHYWYPN